MQLQPRAVGRLQPPATLSLQPATLSHARGSWRLHPRASCACDLAATSRGPHRGPGDAGDCEGGDKGNYRLADAEQARRVCTCTGGVLALYWHANAYVLHANGTCASRAPPRRRACSSQRRRAWRAAADVAAAGLSPSPRSMPRSMFVGSRATVSRAIVSMDCLPSSDQPGHPSALVHGEPLGSRAKSSACAPWALPGPCSAATEA